MNKSTFSSSRSLRLALLCMLAIVLPVFNSCNKESADTGDLLSTVPSSAGFVAGINVKSVLEKAGCSVKGQEITPGKEVTAWIDRQTDVKDSHRKALKLFLDGESGIDPTVAVYFTDAYNGYLTASLADTRKFEEFVSSQTGEQFEDAGDDVRTCSNIAVKGAQLWVCVTSNNTIDAKAVANYATLGESRSFMQNIFSSKIAKMTSDIVGWGDIKAFGRQGFAMSDLSSMNLIAGMLFDNATSIAFDVDFQKGKTAGSLSVLNAKGEPAKYLLPASKIDLSTVKGIGGNAEVIAAMSITKEFTKKIEKIGTSLGGNMFGMFTDALKPVDGTVAVACGNVNDPGSSLSGVVTTDGNPSAELMNMLSGFGETKKDGKLVRFTKGTVDGGLEIDKASDYLKGAVLGFVINMQAPGAGNEPLLKTLAFSLHPDGDGLKCDLTMESTESSKNMLMSLIESDSKK